MRGVVKSSRGLLLRVGEIVRDSVGTCVSSSGWVSVSVSVIMNVSVSVSLSVSVSVIVSGRPTALFLSSPGCAEFKFPCP